MKTKSYFILTALLVSTVPLLAQAAPGPGATGDYASDLTVVHAAEQEAIKQANQLLAQGEGVRDRAGLEAAIKAMQRAQSALEDAQQSPDKLPAALAAEQAAYQALLKTTPHEYRLTQQRSGQPSGNGAGEASQQELNQLDTQPENNRYETESQAAAPQNAQQREQTQTVDRLKELSQRQQDLNERLRELQTALQAANTDAERADLQRQLKRLQDEQRQMLANVDELRQQLNQSPNAASQADTQKQLEQTRNNMERAAQEMDQQSASGALAAGQRAQESMQNLRDNLRKQTSSQFSDQLRQLRNQARDMTKQQDEIARGLDTLNHGDQQPLDNSPQRQQVVQQIQKQQGSLTNLLGQMRAVTEQAESTEPLLAKQLYDTLRRADQMHTDNLLQMGSQLTDRGFIPQASEVERATRTNITELAASVEHAADSVLGSEADTLRYAQKELDDLTKQVEREAAGEMSRGAGGGSNGLAQAADEASQGGSGLGTNAMAGADENSPGGRRQPSAENNPPGRAPGGNGQSANEPGGQGQQPGQHGSGAEQASAENQQNTQGQGEGQGQGQDQAQGQGQAQGQQTAANDNNPGQGNRGGNPRPANNAPGTPRTGPGQAQARAGGNAGGGGDRLRQLTLQLGGGAGGVGNNGPITGNNYVNWADRLRDVQQVVDPADLRNQLATVLEQASVMRANFRQRGQRPDADTVRQQLVLPLTQVRAWVQDELARQQKSDSLVPLDRDPVPDNYAELVRQYYEKLGSAQ